MLGTMSGVEPSVRGRALIELLAHMNEFEAGLYAKVRARVSAADLEVLDRMLPTDWVAASHSRPVIDGIVHELGVHASELWSSLIATRMLRTPLLGGFFDMLVRLGGMSTTRLIKSLPRGWGNAYRGWGEPQVSELDERKALVEFVDVAPYLFEHRQHWVAIEGVLIGLAKVAGETGEVEMHYQPARALVRASVRW